ncbi:MAG: hypothetical protein KDJ99_33445 [Candidatus Competibacteraceae bacterium]|nr:hypothetical protein [Candidatus Competibacteraceae bacterium]
MRCFKFFAVLLSLVPLAGGAVDLSGLGETRDSWERRHGRPSVDVPCPVDCYDGGSLWVIYDEQNRIFQIEIPWTPSVNIRDAHSRIKTMVPPDGQKLRPRVSKHNPQSHGDIYHSLLLELMFTEPGEVEGFVRGEYIIIHQIGRDGKVFSSIAAINYEGN